MPFIQYLRRKWISGKPFPESWQTILERRVPVYRKLPVNYRDQLRKRIPILMSEKYYEGCGGLTLTEEMKVVITAYACVPILEETADYYTGLQAILVYPVSYIAPVHEYDDGGVIREGFEHRSGEYWESGSIVLAWNDIDAVMKGKSEGRNLIIHEFSHQLDDQYGLTAGITDAGKVLRNDKWTVTIAKAYRKLKQQVDWHRPSVLDEYGTTSPAEFFSVASEAFFEKPSALHREMPGLYRSLLSFYRLDPKQWRG